MKKFIALLLIVLASCQVKYKKNENQPKPKNILDEIEQPENKVTNFVKGKDFWPAKYYHLTQVTVENPKFKKQEQRLWEICKGPVLGHIETYDGPKVGRVAYLKTPILFFTDSGFQKEVYVTTGMCRELALHSSHGTDTIKIDAHRKLRYRLKQMTIQYIYTEKTYATELVFESKYKGVTFTVR